jgi:chaperonin GroES
MSKFRPLGDRVLVEPVDESEQKTAGGIIIPDSAKEKPIQGKVVAVGPGSRKDDGERIPMELKKGDRVLYGKYSGTEVKINGTEQLIMRESDVYGVIEG